MKKAQRLGSTSPRRVINQINEKLTQIDISKASKETLYQLGLMILGVKPKDRTEELIGVLQKMTEDNKFFADVRKEFGDEIYRDMLRFVYME